MPESDEEIDATRCSTVLRVPSNKASMFLPGDYPCTDIEGHREGKSATPHHSIVAWIEPPDF